MYKYINKNNEIKSTIKAKGKPKKYLTQKYFIEESGTVIIKDSFQKIFNKPTKKEQKKKINMYSIYKKDIIREFHKNKWAGKELREKWFILSVGI